MDERGHLAGMPVAHAGYRQAALGLPDAYGAAPCSRGAVTSS
ncbi:hypothetical protein ACH4E5_00525 [Streptomyces afghaniensis]